MPGITLVTVAPPGNPNPATRGQALSTVASSVAANLLTVLILGLAFLEDRYFRISQNWVVGPWVTVTSLPHPLRWLAPPLWATVVVPLLAGVAILWRQLKKEKPSLIWVAIAIGVVASNVLAVVGYAAGLK